MNYHILHNKGQLIMNHAGNNGMFVRATKQWYLPALIVFLVFQGLSIRAQETSIDSAYPNIYYSSLKDKLNVYLFGNSRFNQFELVSTSNSDKLIYKPNSNFFVGLGFSYKWMGLSGAFNLKFINDDTEIYGKTQNVDLQLDLYGRKMLWSGGVQYYQGFYWANANDYIPDWDSEDSVPQRPDIKTVNLAINSIYCFNSDRFSFKAIYSNTEWQKKSAGSWLAGGGITLYGVSADSSIIPLNLVESFPRYDSIRNLTNARFSNSVGYTYTLVLKEKYYINATLMLGIALQSISAFGENETDLGSEINLSTNTHLRLSAGYNTERSYFGFNFIADSFLINRSDSPNYTYSYGKFRIFYGRRFTI